MENKISKKEMRKNITGGDVLDVIYEDGTKKKLDKQKLSFKKTRIEQKRVVSQNEISRIDDNIALINEEVASKK
jgi:transcriptional regulator NrdR family protein